MYSLNGHAAAGNSLAPQSWIEYTFNFLVDPKGTVVLTGGEAKTYPSISIFSYSNGKTNDLFEQTESRSAAGLDKPAQSIDTGPTKSDPVHQDMQRQCGEGNQPLEQQREKTAGRDAQETR